MMKVHEALHTVNASESDKHFTYTHQAFFHEHSLSKQTLQRCLVNKSHNERFRNLKVHIKTTLIIRLLCSQQQK